MIEKKIKVLHKDGVHMRPAMFITDLAMKFDSDITIEKNGKEVDAKSIMQLTMLAVLRDEEMTVKASGADEQEAVDAIEELIISNFNDLSNIKG